MKRSAEAMDSRDLKDGDCSSGRSSRKHIRSADERRSRNRNEGITVKTLSDEKETDPHRLAQRQKQIDYGKNTIGYDRYCAQVPRRERRRGKHPMTPDKNLCVGKKVFDGFVRKWRQALHKYDPPELAEVTLAASAARSTRAESEEKGSAEGIVPSSEHAAAIATCASTTSSSVSEVKKTTRTGDERSATLRRTIYETFDDDTFEADGDDSDDDLL
uniref:Histone RNA hairpin-binding protein RNA-binding domain-containing protein n=1 Tax=Hyaloperonospora arabidopsidis (strain Emoy2) TaxID=559515 RepID=M4B5M8_HYAAE